MNYWRRRRRHRGYRVSAGDDHVLYFTMCQKFKRIPEETLKIWKCPREASLDDRDALTAAGTTVPTTHNFTTPDPPDTRKNYLRSPDCELAPTRGAASRPVLILSMGCDQPPPVPSVRLCLRKRRKSDRINFKKGVRTEKFPISPLGHKNGIKLK